MEHPFKEITKLLQKTSTPFELLTHEAVYTSDQAAKIRGLSAQAGAKSLLLKGDKKFYLAALPGSRRLDSKKFKSAFNLKNFRFATPEEVEKIMGCQIGACYPFGNLFNVQTIADPSLGENDVIAFNPGVHTKTIKIKWQDYLLLANPLIVDIGQNS